MHRLRRTEAAGLGHAGEGPPVDPLLVQRGMRRLFVLRPEPAAHRTVERARSLGMDVTAIPLFELEAVEWSPPDPTQFDGILLTSANAVNMGGGQLERLRRLPVHAVGDATAVAAEVAGFGVASIGRGGVRDLLESI